MFAVTYWCVGLYCVSDTYRHTKISTSIPFGHLLVVVRCCSYSLVPCIPSTQSHYWLVRALESNISWFGYNSSAW